MQIIHDTQNTTTSPVDSLAIACLISFTSLDIDKITQQQEIKTNAQYIHSV
jgi:hypothetical protein